MNKKIIGIGILFIFLLSLCMYPVSAEKENFEHSDRIAELKELKDVQHSEIKTQFDKSNYGNKIKDTKDFNDKAEVYSNADVSTLEVWKGNDNSLKFRDNGKAHKVRDLKISYSDLAEVPGFNAGHVKLTHYNDAGIPDVSWVQYVPNDGGFGYIDGVPFSEVVIGGYVGTYSITGNVVYQDSQTFGLGATFQPDKINYISANVTQEIIESGPYDVPTDGLVGLWLFDEISGINVSDSSGNNNHGSLDVLSPWGTGKYNNGVYLYGNASVSITDVCFLSSDPWTIGTYIKWAGNTSDITMYMGNKGTSTESFGLRIADQNKFFYRTNAGDYYTYEESDYIIDNQSLVTWVADGYGNLSLYVNSCFCSTTDVQNTSITFNNFGKGYTSYANEYVGGFDFSYIYNRSLSESEIKQIYYDTITDLTIKSNSIPSDPTTGGTVSVPFSDIGADISTLTTSVPTNTTIDNVTVRYYNETVTPFNITTEIGYTENTTIISEELTDEYYRVYITHIPGCDYASGFVNYTSDSNDILDSPFLQTNLSSNNDNSSYTLDTYDWSITTGPITQGTVYNYVLTAYLEGTVIDYELTNGGFGYIGLGPYEASGDETTIIGSRYTAYSNKESEWGGNGSDIYNSASAIILVVVITIAIGFAITGLKAFRRKDE